MAYEIIVIDEHTWQIDEDGGHVRFFLLEGSKEALLIDSGMQINNAKDIAKTLTTLPIKLLNTHADRDHLGSITQFDTFYMNPAEASNFYHTQGQNGDFVPIENGDVLDLGDRELEIISLPGHTPGSIAVLDRKAKRLFSGDPIQDGSIFMFGVQREIHAYRKSLKKLDAYRDGMDLIYPSHGTCPVSPEIIDALYEGSGKIMQGEIPYKEVDMWGNKIRHYDTGAAVFLMDL